MLNNVYEMIIFYIKMLPTYLLIVLFLFLSGIIGIFVKLYTIRFDRLSEEFRTKTLLKKEWYRNFLVYFHGASHLKDEESGNNNKLELDTKRAEIRFKDKTITYKKESNEIKLLKLLIGASGTILTIEQVAKYLDVPQTFEIEMGTNGYKKYVYEIVSKLRAYLAKEFDITATQASELIITVKDKGYRIGNITPTKKSR